MACFKNSVNILLMQCVKGSCLLNMGTSIHVFIVIGGVMMYECQRQPREERNCSTHAYATQLPQLSASCVCARVCVSHYKVMFHKATQLVHVSLLVDQWLACRQLQVAMAITVVISPAIFLSLLTPQHFNSRPSFIFFKSLP